MEPVNQRNSYRTKMGSPPDALRTSRSYRQRYRDVDRGLKRKSATALPQGESDDPGNDEGRGFDRFLKVFSTKGAEKRKQHGSKGPPIFRDPSEDDRVWVLFDWDAAGWQSFVSDAEVPKILQEAGHQGRPQGAELGGQYDA